MYLYAGRCETDLLLQILGLEVELDKKENTLYKVIKNRKRDETMTEKIRLNKDQSKKLFACVREFIKTEKRYDRNHIVFILAKMMNFI